MKDFIKKTEKELQALITEKKLALRAFRFGVAGSNVKNVKEGKGLKKEIAQINTILTERASGIITAQTK